MSRPLVNLLRHPITAFEGVAGSEQWSLCQHRERNAPDVPANWPHIPQQAWDLRGRAVFCIRLLAALMKLKLPERLPPIIVDL